jgi:hypothetical protein
MRIRNPVGNSKDSSSNRKASFKQGTSAREGTTATAKCQQQQDLCARTIKVAENEGRNMAVIKKFGGCERSPSFCKEWQ